MIFRNAQESHTHSKQVLDLLYEYDDFMLSITSMVDLGCGEGLDLEWWASRTTRDENPEPLNIRCTGVDVFDSIPVAKSRRYVNINYQKTNFESGIIPKKDTKFDVLWCHDSFQYAINPLATLKHWYEIASPDAMLVLIVPQTTNFDKARHNFVQPSGCYYHYSLVNLMHMLAVSGWDCGAGFFRKEPNDIWLKAVVYRSQHSPMDPRTTTWYDLCDRKLLPESAVESVKRHGYVKQQELVLPWLDHSLMALGQF